MAGKYRTILVFPAQAPKPLPQPDPKDTAREATAATVKALLAEALPENDLLGRLCGSLVVARIRQRGGKR